jgi:hypothetical protein
MSVCTKSMSACVCGYECVFVHTKSVFVCVGVSVSVYVCVCECEWVCL